MRFLDIGLSVLFIIILSIPFAIIALFVKLTSPGPIFYWSERVGHMNRIFLMPKFRSMNVGAPVVATHLLKDQDYLTPIGKILRKTSLDELPQLLSVFVGDMAFVGPRPALFNQDDLIQMRTLKNIHTIRPGITGWAQVNGRDEISIEQKVALDEVYLHKKSLWFDIKILFITLKKVLVGSGVSH